MMNLTPRQLAHVLAALRYCQDKDLRHMPHFGEVMPLSGAEIDELCELFNMESTDESVFTVVGVLPDSDWGAGLYEASFVEHATAEGPIQAAQAARLEAARKRMEFQGANDETTIEKEAAEFAQNILVLAAFRGELEDLHDPRLEADDDETPGRKER